MEIHSGKFELLSCMEFVTGKEYFHQFESRPRESEDLNQNEFYKGQKIVSFSGGITDK